jgi:hypothetical protein
MKRFADDGRVLVGQTRDGCIRISDDTRGKENEENSTSVRNSFASLCRRSHPLGTTARTVPSIEDARSRSFSIPERRHSVQLGRPLSYFPATGQGPAMPHRVHHFADRVADVPGCFQIHVVAGMDDDLFAIR